MSRLRFGLGSGLVFFLFICVACSAAQVAPTPMPLTSGPTPTPVPALPTETSTTEPTATSVPPTPTRTPLPPTPEHAATTGPPRSTDASVPMPAITLETMVDIGGYSLYIRCGGEGEPTVILEAGAGRRGDFWMRVWPQVAQFTHTCFYNRASLGGSDASPNSPRTSLDMAEELHTLLANAALQGPFVLAGHSWGGFIVRMYASQHPEEVAGLVFVDSVHPRHNEVLGAVDGKWILSPFWSVEGGILWSESTALVPEAAPLGDFPLVVITHGKPYTHYWGGGPFKSTDAFEGAWLELQTELTLLSTNSTLLIAEESGHEVPRDQPQIIVDTIRDMVLAIRGE